MTSYVVSPEARRDVLQIIEYLLAESPSAAARFERDLLQALDLLSANAALGHRREDLTLQPVRFWTVMRRYLIVYRGAEPIEVARVLSGYRDVTALLE